LTIDTIGAIEGNTITNIKIVIAVNKESLRWGIIQIALWRSAGIEDTESIG
jgi:hypothetical protein